MAISGEEYCKQVGGVRLEWIRAAAQTVLRMQRGPVLACGFAWSAITG